MRRIATVDGHHRMSTQDLLLAISEAVAAGETEFQILASGQHDIGGPLWNAEGKPLMFNVTNPGQRVGSMCLPGTRVVVNGPVPADAGWLNSGGIIAIRGDAGDTAGHCAAAGKIYIGGRAGTRSGSLMKQDPQSEPPELWVLNSVGSFSFEFMGGGRAVVCGHKSQVAQSVLGDRPCVGMVGGVVYFRGPCSSLPPDVKLLPIDEEDRAWLDRGLDEFLEAVDQRRLKPEFSIWRHWRKLVPAQGRDAGDAEEDISSFRKASWPENGLFGDVFPDDRQVAPLVASGEGRLNEPFRQNAEKCVDCRACMKACPRVAIRRRCDGEKPEYSIKIEQCIGCGICKAICPKSVWGLRLYK